MSTKALPPVIKHKDSVYTYVDGGVLSGYTKRGTIPEQFPWIWWSGTKMPHLLWQTIIAFFEYTYDKSKDESVVYLYYNEETNQWMAWAPPQRGMGMTVRTVDDHVNWKQQEEFPGGFVRVGTGHHHCVTNAFQSGTDSNDEFTGNGLHFTVGLMDKEFHDLHARAVFNGNMIEVELDDWIELADKYRALNLPPELIGYAYDYSLQSKAPKEIEVPQMWKDNFLSFATTGYGLQTSHQGHCSQELNRFTGTSEVNGVKGYWRDTGGNREFVPFANQHSQTNASGSGAGANSNGKYSYTPGEGHKPSETGKSQLDELQRKGLSVTDLNLICDNLRTTQVKDWTGDKDHLAVINIIKSNGLNVRWLEKYIEMEEAIQDSTRESNNGYFNGMGA